MSFCERRLSSSLSGYCERVSLFCSSERTLCATCLVIRFATSVQAPANQEVRPLCIAYHDTTTLPFKVQQVTIGKKKTHPTVLEDGILGRRGPRADVRRVFKKTILCTSKSITFAVSGVVSLRVFKDNLLRLLTESPKKHISVCCGKKDVYNLFG